MQEISSLCLKARLYKHLMIGLCVALILFLFKAFEIDVRVSYIAESVLGIAILLYVSFVKKAFSIALKQSLLNVRLLIISAYKYERAICAILLLAYLGIFFIAKLPLWYSLVFYLLVFVYILIAQLSFYVMKLVNVAVIVKADDGTISDVLMHPACSLKYVDSGRSVRVSQHTHTLAYLEVDLRLHDIVVSTDKYDEAKFLEHFEYCRDDVGVEYSDYCKLKRMKFDDSK